jgi:DeoR/GlpR family transcriptional regulator of sugar metabolism
LDNGRRNQIIQLLEQYGEVNLQKLGELFPQVSVMTLRRDLIHLEKAGFLVRTHGGAVSIRKFSGNSGGTVGGEEDAYSMRASENVDAKLVIAEKALGILEEGRSVFLDSGSTLMCLAGKIPDDNFSVITSGMNIALELIKKSNISVVALGGQINRNTLSMSGPNANSLLGTMNIDLAFMSASGFSIENGFTVANIYECELKRNVVKKAKLVIILMDTSKINKVLPFTYASLDDIDIWVCEKALPCDIMAVTAGYGIKVF